MIRTILTVALIALAGATAQAQDYEQHRKWCYEDSTDDETITGCDAVIASGRMKGDDLAAAYGARGYAYNRKGMYDRALADHNTAIEMNPREAMAFNNRGWTYNNMKQYQRALQDFEEALRLRPGMPEAYNNRGVSYNGMGQYDRAIQEYDEAIRLRPGYPVATRNRDRAIANKANAGGGSGAPKTLEPTGESKPSR
jgi:tetratricopeptide (TPR) repeat protein